ncbi:MAG TPA: TonB-dependent receptor [Bryobacteraceae bacterium]|nr:TonB-dependent receptor [Bryobacteraceae bacterium]
MMRPPVIFAILFLCGSYVTAQTTASIAGSVRDNSGAVIPQVKVVVVNTQTSYTRASVTDDSGNYLIPNLPLGDYTATMEKDGFQRHVQRSITLVVNQNVRLDVTLTVGQVTESVNVTAPPVDVDTRTATIGEVVDRARIQELPLNGRNAMALARVVPGVISVSAPSAPTNGRSGPAITVAGGRDTQNEFRLDGISHRNLTHNSALNFPSPDALQEFKVLTSSFSSEFGRNAGGVFLGVTRAGTNQFHGGVWEFLRNKQLNARNFFSVDKPDLKQNQFGFTFGGPAIRNRTFFFGSYQGTRIRESQLFATARPPSATLRGGDFTTSAQRPRDPLNGNQPFPNGVIPAARFDPVAVAMQEKYLPLPNTPDGRWVALLSRPTDADQYLFRVDHTFTTSNSLNFRFFRDSSDVQRQNGNIGPYSPNRERLLVYNLALQDTHTFSPSLINEFRLGMNRVDTNTKSLDDAQMSDFGARLPGVFPPQLPRLTIDGYFTLDSGLNYIEHPNVYQLSDSMSWFRRKHSLKWGGEFERSEMINRASTASNAFLRFDGSITGNAYADYLIGRPLNIDQGSPYDRVVKGYNWFVFLQDEFRVSQRVTVSAGLRYEYFRPYYHVHDWTNTFRAGQQSRKVPSAPVGVVFPGDPGIDRGLVPADKNNFAPRLGIAWDPRGDGKLSIRAAYGLFYEDFRSDIWTYPSVNQPFVIREVVNNPFSLSDPYRGRVNPFPYIYTPTSAKFNFPMGLFTVPAPVITAPYVHNVSVSVETAFFAGSVIKAAYVGKLGHNLLRMVERNPATYIPGQSTIANTDSRRPLLPGVYTSVREVATNSNSSYHSLQLSASRRFSNGFTILGAYTMGKFLDYYSAQNLGQLPQDPNNWAAERSRSDEDRRHVFVTSFVYELPVLRAQKGWIGKAFGGWGVSGVVSILSGLPVWVRSDRDFSLTGVNFDRPDLVGNPVRSHADRNDMIQRFFNTGAFTANQPGRYGNAGRNLFSGPAQSGTDLSLTKNFAISERLGKIQFRTEFFNTWNQVNFGGPEARFTNRLFGVIQTAGSPRILQFALRYQF